MDEPVLFTCSRQPGGLRLTPSACSNNYQRSKKAQPWDSTYRCRGCEVGATHAGEKPAVPKTTKSCTRCGRTGFKMLGLVLCVSCFNRFKEWIKGSNGKGSYPTKYEIPLIWSDLSVERILLARTESEAAEIYRRHYQQEPEKLICFGEATRAEAVDWWKEVTAIQKQSHEECRPGYWKASGSRHPNEKIQIGIAG